MKKLALIFFLLTSPLMGESRLDKAESLVLETRYDEALEILNLETDNSPRYHYNKMICEYALFMKDAGLQSAKRLLDFDNLPLRYKDLGEKIQYELENMNPDSIEHVASLMKDSQRRLNLGHGGRKVQKVQAETIAVLDYLIEKMEKQSGGGSSSENCPGEQRATPSKSNQSNEHAKDSQVKGDKAPGEVDEKNITGGAAWGNLPPKAQAEAKQYAEKNYPPHYKKIIEEYNKRLAERKR